jgi:hypothetical protein
MKEHLLDQLLEDAILVAAFGQRAGKLSDSSLFEAIQRAKANPKLGWHSPEVASLQSSLNDASRAIHPVTLIDLKYGWNPFVKRPSFFRRLSPSRILFIVLAFVLISVSIHYTQWQKRAESIIDVFENGIVDEENRIHFEIVDEYLVEFDKNKIDELEERSEFMEMLRNAHKISERVWSAQEEYREVTDLYFRLTGAIIEQDVNILIKDYNEYKNISNVPPKARPPISDMHYCVKRIQNALNPDDIINDMSNDLSIVLNKLNKYSTEDSVGVDFIKCLTGSIRPVSGVKYDEADLRQNIEFVSLWLLPAIFGMFGAVVYQLRACLDRMRPDPRIGRAIMRIVLGALGGIAFGWFWSPDGTDGLLPPTLPLGAYAIAFLIGYSIDIFYSLVDRVVVSISASIEKVGPSTAQKNN